MLYALAVCALGRWVLFDWLEVETIVNVQATSQILVWHAQQIAVGISIGIAVGIVFGIAFGIFEGIAVGVPVGIAIGIAGGITIGIAIGVAIGVVGGIALGIASGIAFGIATGKRSFQMKIFISCIYLLYKNNWPYGNYLEII